MYIYIYIERERDIDVYTYTYYVLHIMRPEEVRAQGGPGFRGFDPRLDLVFTESSSSKGGGESPSRYQTSYLKGSEDVEFQCGNSVLAERKRDSARSVLLRSGLGGNVSPAAATRACGLS